MHPPRRRRRLVWAWALAGIAGCATFDVSPSSPDASAPAVDAAGLPPSTLDDGGGVFVTSTQVSLSA